MSSRSYRAKAAGALVIALAAFGTACLLAGRLLPPPADCAADARNPYRFRDWKNYVDGIRKTGDAAVVALISDSQGYAGEHLSWRGYPARLEGILNERRTGGFDRWEVLNFSIDGVTPMEYMALAARLQEESPAWVISVSGSADYHGDNFTRGFSFARSDLPNLLTEWRRARRLPFAFWRRHGRVEDTLTAWMADRLPLLPFRDFQWSWLDVRYPGIQKVFYAPLTSYRFWELPGKARTAVIPDPLPAASADQLDLTYDDRSAIMLGEFIAQLARIPARHHLVAACPLKTDFGDSRAGRWISRFRVDLENFSSGHGLDFWDMTEALEPEDFISGNHLSPRGHWRMAELLADRIAAEMER